MAKSILHQVVREARAIVADRRKRARGVEAVDCAGNEADPCGTDAVRFCAVGALIRASFDLTGDWEASHRLGWSIAGMIDRSLQLNNEGGDGYGLVLLSDTRGQKAVLHAFEEFLESAI